MQKILKLGYDISQKEKEDVEKEVVDFREEKLRSEKSDEGRMALEKEWKVGKKEVKREGKENAKIRKDLSKVGSLGSMFKNNLDLNLDNYYENDINDDRVLYDEELYDHELFSDEDEVMKKSASSDSYYENRRQFG